MHRNIPVKRSKEEQDKLNARLDALIKAQNFIRIAFSEEKVRENEEDRKKDKDRRSSKTNNQ